MKLLAVFCVVLGLCACGGDDDGASATGGDGGAAGSAGTGGTGGVAGSAGTGGTGGVAGSAGTGGTGGSAGTGGDAGSAGTGGTGGGDACDDITCDDNATCSATGSGPVCVCNSGYVGDGTTCTDVDECEDASDNCPDNATCVNTEGGFRCDCDMLGTYAGVLYTEASWTAVGDGLILNGSAVLPSFELRTITAQDNGELTITVRACGGTTADFCVDPRFLATEPIPVTFPSIAFGQDFPRSLWGNLDAATATVPMPVVAVGEPFLTSDQAAFLGLSLAGDPLQEWPTDRNDPAITWLDPDEDTVPGVTSLARHVDRNGDPEYDDVGESAECAAAFPPNSWDDPSTVEVETTWDDPNTSEVETLGYPLDRIGYADVTWPYDYWVTPSAGGEKVKAFHTGARTVSRFNGAITSCDTIEGELVVSEINARLHSCVTDSDTACSESIVDALDGAPDPNTIEGGCFQFVRVDDNATCESVRAHVFDLLVNGRCPAPSL